MRAFLADARPDFIFATAAKLAIQNHLIHGAHLAGVQRLMFLGSSRYFVNCFGHSG